MIGVREAWPRPLLRSRGGWRETIETVLLIIVVFTGVNLASTRFYVDGPSMEPTLFTGQNLLISRAHYLFGQPARGDILVFQAPGDDFGHPPLIKRVVGLPGETVEMRANRVYIDDRLLDEPYLVEACELRCPEARWTLAAGEYFMMGDNRNDSRDSRSFGAVSVNRVLGEAVLRYWPLTALQLFEGSR